MSILVLISRHGTSFIPRHKEEEEKGPGFSCSRMHLIILDFNEWKGIPMMPSSHTVDYMAPLSTVSNQPS